MPNWFSFTYGPHVRTIRGFHQQSTSWAMPDPTDHFALSKIRKNAYWRFFCTLKSLFEVLILWKVRSGLSIRVHENSTYVKSTQRRNEKGSYKLAGKSVSLFYGFGHIIHHIYVFTGEFIFGGRAKLKTDTNINKKIWLTMNPSDAK